MFKKIVNESIEHIWHHTKIIRLAFMTSFFHTLAVIALITYNLNNLIVAKFHWWFSYSNLVNYVKQETNIVIIIIIVWFIWYEVLYPIGQSIIINFLHQWSKKMGEAISKWFNKFFIMFEFNNLLLPFSGITFLTTLLRLGTLDITNNTVIHIMIAIRWFCVLYATIFWPYVLFAINIEGLSLYDALKRSSSLAIANMWLTLKFVLFQGLLLLRFLINIVIVLGVPIIIVFLSNKLNILGATTSTLITCLVIFLIIWSAYLNGIIEAFFLTYRHNVYKKITSEEKIN